MTTKRKTNWGRLVACVVVALGAAVLVRALISVPEPVPTEPRPFQLEFERDERERKRDSRIWREELPKALAGADRLVVSVGQFARNGSVSPVTVTGMKEVGEFVALIKFAGFDHQCKCGGEVLFTFFKDDAESAALTWHHGKRLRWWKKELIYDAELTGKSRSNLAAWLKENGYTGAGEWEEVLAEGRREVPPPETTP